MASPGGVVKVAVIGYGYWGPNLVRNFQENPAAEVVAIADLSEDRLALARKRFPFVDVHDDIDAAIGAADAVVLATPVTTHRPLATRALRAGKHVWCEKPLAETLDDVVALAAEAKAADRHLFVDHTFVFTGAVRKLRELHESGHFGDIQYFDTTRANLGLFQRDASVVQDLAPHDLSIFFFVTGNTVTRVSAVARHFGPGHQPSQAYILCETDAGYLAHFHLNWLSPMKIRTTILAGSEKMAVYDDNNSVDKVRIYDSGISWAGQREQALVSYRVGDVWSPRIDPTEALGSASRAFTAQILEGAKSPAGVVEAAQVAAVMDAAHASIASDGAWVTVRSADVE